MLKNLKTLLSIRAWFKSTTLSVAGVLGLIATMDLTTGTGVIQGVIDFAVQNLGIMPATALAWLTLIKTGADAILRTKTDRSLAQKIEPK